LYCPKMVTDTVIVKVVPTFRVDAGNDESVVIGQPYPLNAEAIGNTEIVTYQWQPSSYLSNTTIQNPIATIGAGASDIVTFQVKATTVVGNCSATDAVSLKVFKIGPDILLPTAFTPNNDGKNDVLKPILIGMNRLEFFSVYNRYGQVVYTTSQKDKGWDGTVKGVLQNSGVFVVVAKGTDYLGKRIVKKGTVVLIR
jgi:gliding motility-associated-like protein